jgi:protein TonB
MSSTSLAVPSRAHPDPVRIAALSATSALNLAAFVIAVRPKAPALMAAALPHTSMLVQWIESPKPAPQPPPIVMKPLPPEPVAAPHVTPMAINPPVTVPTTEGRIAAPITPPSTVPHTGTPTATAAPVEATLAYRSAPLRYPPTALRQHLQGTVLLRVLVDETGKPVEVQIAHSSGYRLLDHSAREQVLAGWRFTPAMANGHPVQAWAQVPVSFALRQF